jgi:signal transduction histidine kinase
VIFRRATIRLMVAFTAAQLLLFAAFALGVYIFVTGTFDFDSAQHDGEAAVNTAEQGFATLRNGLIISYAALLLIVPVVSYVMARLALLPVKLSYERQERFVDGASHELRTPLSIIQGELELVTSRTRTVAEYEQAITIALEEIGSLTDLTNDLLLLSHSAGRYPRAEMVTCSLNDLVVEAAKRKNSPRGPESAQLTVDLGRAASVTVARPLMLRAIINLIDNALKFTPQSGTINVRTEIVNGTPVVSVADTGIGMNAHATAHATDRFWRADDARTRPGHGVGLALVSQIIKAHGGGIEITSATGAGTVVRLVFSGSRA